MPGPKPSVRLVVRTSLGKGVSAKEIEHRLKRMMSALKLRGPELSVLLTGNAQMRELNRLYRKKDRTTDVLSFAMNEGYGNLPRRPEAMPRLLGDVIVSMPKARLQAKEAGRPALEEATMLLAHGLLHLLGWDHATEADDQAMRAETERLCVAARAPRKAARSRNRRAQRRQTSSRKLS